MNGYGKRKNRALPYDSAEEDSFWSSGVLGVGDHDGVALTNVNFYNFFRALLISWPSRPLRRLCTRF